MGRLRFSSSFFCSSASDDVAVGVAAVVVVGVDVNVNAQPLPIFLFLSWHLNEKKITTTAAQRKSLEKRHVEMWQQINFYAKMNGKKMRKFQGYKMGTSSLKAQVQLQLQVQVQVQLRGR